MGSPSRSTLTAVEGPLKPIPVGRGGPGSEILAVFASNLRAILRPSHDDGGNGGPKQGGPTPRAMPAINLVLGFMNHPGMLRGEEPALISRP